MSDHIQFDSEPTVDLWLALSARTTDTKTITRSEPGFRRSRSYRVRAEEETKAMQPIDWRSESNLVVVERPDTGQVVVNIGG